MESIINNNFWKEGPAFLHQEEHWPPARNAAIQELSKPAQEEVTKVQTHTGTLYTCRVAIAGEPTDLPHQVQYSSWNRLVRVTAWVNRFVNLMKAGKEAEADRTYS
jgi:hypothetical protein